MNGPRTGIPVLLALVTMLSVPACASTEAEPTPATTAAEDTTVDLPQPQIEGEVSLEVESIKTLNYDMVQVMGQKPLKDGIEVMLKMIPPDPEKVHSHMYSDTLEIRLKDDAEPISVMVKGFYTAEVIAKARKSVAAKKIGQ